MIATFKSLKNLIRAKSYHIDHPIFRLHYQVTVCLLLAFCIILTAKVLFGDTIDCKSRVIKRNDFYDNICYARGTYTEYAMDLAHMQAALESSNISPHGFLERLAEQARQQNRTLPPEALIKLPEEKGILEKMRDYVVSTITSEDGGVELEEGFEEVHTVNLSVPFTTFVPEGPLDDLLSGTEVGRFLQDQFRLMHRLVRNNDLNFTSNIFYLYSGILVPDEDTPMVGVTYWHRYYQYIPIILFLEALLFYLPHYLWKNWENGIVLSICKRLYDNRLAPTEYIDANYHLIDYLRNCFLLNRSLVYKYYFCHLLLIVNLILQVLVLNATLNNQFITYGLDMFIYSFVDRDIYGLRSQDGYDDDLNNPADFVFPKITQCTFKAFSQAGVRPDHNQLLCALPLNILHDKFFLVLWFWFLILGILTTLQLIFDSFYILIPRVRKSLFALRFGPYLSDDNIHSSSLPELFLLDLIGTNSDKFAFSALLKRLNKDDYQSNREENQSLV